VESARRPKAKGGMNFSTPKKGVKEHTEKQGALFKKKRGRNKLGGGKSRPLGAERAQEGPALSAPVS